MTVAGPVNRRTGWVMDFGMITRLVEPLLAQLDHHDLNAVDGLANPTSELIAEWFWDRLVGDLPQLSAITVAESDTAWCTYRGE